LKSAIDVHVHLAALPEAGNGCHVSRRMMRNPLFRYLAWSQGLDLRRPGAANARYVERLLIEVSRSERIKQVVLLGMDGVYDAAGELDLAASDFLVSNRYVCELARRYPGSFLAGVSINPSRRDALEELERTVEEGAVLVKVLPNSQLFDPGDKRFIPFYRALARHGLPLLSHVGFEFALIGKDQSAGDPRRLRTALDEGTSVIAAHGCSRGLGYPDSYLAVFAELVRSYPRFFVDTSALTLPNRVSALFFLTRHPELHDRLVFGTDYPLPVFCYPVLGRSYGSTLVIKNSFDRQVRVLESLNIRFRDFSSLGSAPGG